MALDARQRLLESTSALAALFRGLANAAPPRIVILVSEEFAPLVPPVGTLRVPNAEVGSSSLLPSTNTTNRNRLLRAWPASGLLD